MNNFGVLILAFLATWVIIAGIGVFIRLMYDPGLYEYEDDLTQKKD
jgi:hypothetical protein